MGLMLQTAPAPEPVGTGGTVLIERYGDTFDPARGGGIETAGHHLARALERAGFDVRWYRSDDWTSPADYAAMVARSGADMVLPLVDSPAFARVAGFLPAVTRRRIVRVWHDVSLLAMPTHPIPSCPGHAGEGDACIAARLSPTGYGANVFFFDEPWTRCFAPRHYIPWAVDHLPAIDHRAADGPVVLLVGKMRISYAIAILDACRRSGIAVRIVFSNWSRLGQQSRAHIAARAADPGVEIIERYDLRADAGRVFGGASAALVLSQYHETFGFLAAEAVQCGIPVIAFAGSGGVTRFASAVARSVGEVVAMLDAGVHATLTPVARADWGWRDVAAAYARLAHDVSAAAQGRAA